MADEEHVVKKVKTEQSSIFDIFSKLLNSNNIPEKSCVLLFDSLKWDSRKVGSVDASVYVCKRLVRGLASTQTKRESVVFSTLTSALKSNVLSVSNVLSALDNEVKNNGPSKSEQGIASTITVLTCGSIIKSGQYLDLPAELQQDVVKRLITYGAQKQYLRNAVSAFFVELLTNLSKDIFKTAVLPIMKELASKKDIDDENYAVIFLCAWNFPKATDRFVTERFGSKIKLCEEVIPRCAYYPPIVQNEILRLHLSSLSREPRELIRFWKMIVDHEHKVTPRWSYFILNYCKTILNYVEAPSLIVKVLCPEIAKLFLLATKKQANKSNSDEFQNICKVLLEMIVKRLTLPDVDKKLSLQVIKLFLFDGDLNFDRLLKTRTIHLLVENLDLDCVKIFLDEVKEILSGKSAKSDASGKKVEWTAKERQSFLPVFGGLLSHQSVRKNYEVCLNGLKYLFAAGFLKESGLNSDLRRHAKDMFFKSVELRYSKMDTAVLLLNDLIVYIDSNFNELSDNMSESAMTEWKSVINANGKFGKICNSKKFIAVRLLLLHMGLLLFRDADLATGTIRELLECYDRIEGGRKNRKSKKAAEEPQWVEVIVDLLLALLSRENKLLRQVVNSVFPSIAPEITPTALQQIVDALDPAARNDVLKHVDSDNSDDDGDSDEGGDSGDEEESEGSDLEDEETERETVNDKLRMAVRNALGYSASMTDDESVDMDQMNEEEGERLNESLANAFRMFRSSKGSKKKQSKDDEAKTHFRIRVLDLIEIIVTTNPSLATCLDLVLPLITLLEITIKDPHQKPLQNRLESVLKKLGKIKKFEKGDNVDCNSIVELFKGLFGREVSGLVYTEMAPALTECSNFLVKASQLVPQSDVSLQDCFTDLLDRFFRNNDRKVPYAVFPSVLRLLWDGNWKVAKHIMKLLLDKDLKLFKKVRLLDLLEVFYNNDRLQSTATDDWKTTLCTAESKFVKKLSGMLDDYNSQDSKTKMIATFYSRLIQIIQLAVSALNKFRNDCPTVPQWKIVIEKLVLCTTLLQQQRTKTKLSRLAHLYDVPMPVLQKKVEAKKPKVTVEEKMDTEEVETMDGNNSKRKRKISEGPNEESVSVVDPSASEVPKKKKKHMKKGGNLAKESRALREAASSQGLEDVAFSSVAFESIHEDTEDPVTKKKQEGSDGKKKKTKGKA